MSPDITHNQRTSYLPHHHHFRFDQYAVYRISISCTTYELSDEESSEELFPELSDEDDLACVAVD